MQYRFAEFDFSDKTATEVRHHRAHLLLFGLVFCNNRDRVPDKAFNGNIRCFGSLLAEITAIT